MGGDLVLTAKHFAGRGDSDIDAHYAVPNVPGHWGRLESVALKPYRVLIENGLPSIMLAHATVPAADPSRQRMANNLVAKVNGRNHRTSLHTDNPAYVPEEMAIELASKNGYGSFQRGECRASGATLANNTPARVILFPGASGNTIISRGPVTDHSKRGNTIRLESLQ